MTEVHTSKTNGHAEAPEDLEYEESLQAQLRETAVEESVAEPEPPYDLDAEAAVLSSILVDEEMIPVVRQLLRPEQFYSEAHRVIGKAIFAIHDEGRTADIITVASKLRDMERLAQVGGMAYLTDVINASPAHSSKRVASYAKIVTKLANQRDIVATCKIAASGLLNRRADIAIVLESLRTQIEIVDSPLENPITSTDDIFAELPPIPFLIPGLGIAPGAPVLVGGYGYSGKTVAIQAMAVAVASGRNVWNQYKCEVGRVLHIDYEQGSHLTKERYQRIAHGMHIQKDYFAGRLETMILPSMKLDNSAANSTLARLGDGRRLIIIDSFRACAPSLEENSSEVRTVLDAATWASEKTGCVFLFIHHARKPSEGQTGGAKMSFRGSSAFFDASGSAFVFVGEKGEPVVIEHEKCRTRGITEEAFQLTIGDTDGRRGLTVAMQEASEVASARQATETAKAEKKAAERTKQREESQRRLAAEQTAAVRERETKRATQAQVDDRAILEIIAIKPGLGVAALRAEMAAKLGECGRGRVEDALARQAGNIRIALGDKNARQHHLAVGDLRAALEAVTTPSGPGTPVVTHGFTGETMRPATGWADAMEASAEVEDDTGEQ